MKTTQNLSVWLLLLLAATGEVSAQSNVDSRVEKLEETIRILERRVVDLEARTPGRSAPASIASDKVNWRKLQNGVSEGDVEKLLGSPSRVNAGIAFTFWQYGDRGRVDFDGKTRTVMGWSEP